jgi:orotate phosphoribosyltransferase
MNDRFHGLPNKEYGTWKLAEGGAIAGRNLVIMKDVITTGRQT